MKKLNIVILDGNCANPGDLSWEEFEKLGEVTVYPSTEDGQVVERAKDADIVIKSFDRNKLIEAYGQVFLRFTKEEQQMAVKKIKKDKFTVSEKITLISTVLQEKKSVKFSDLYKEDASRVEIITTFQALLELMKKQYLTATQESFYADIVLTLNEDADGKPIDLSELTKTEDKYDE